LHLSKSPTAVKGLTNEHAPYSQDAFESKETHYIAGVTIYSA